MSNAERFRQAASNCLQIEAEAVNMIEKKALLWMAEEWLRLAQAAEVMGPNPGHNENRNED
jgi:hypothetical protein